MRLNIVIFGILIVPLNLTAQTDSTIVGFDTFMKIVQANHPVSKQADLLIETGEANLRRARGNFDPELKSSFDQKEFEGKEYYQLNTNELKIPTPLGVELKAGYDNNTGTFADPENRTPQNGLTYAGIAVPLGKGLFFDERRQAVRQAEVFERATVLERTLMLNQLIFDAAKAYWEWYSAWNSYNIYDASVQLAEFRFRGVLQSFEQGDVPAIDTLEAFILVQNRELSRNEAWINVQQTRLEASNYLWSEDMQPLQLIDDTKPVNYGDFNINDPIEDTSINSILSGIEQVHPKIMLYYNKLEDLNFERRMKVEKIKPKLNVNYNLLNQPIGGNAFEGFSANDYKWGLEFSMPLLLRKERGDLQITKIKINQTDLDRQQQTLEIRNKIKAYQAEIQNLYDQIDLYQKTVNNYTALLNGEIRKFQEGESSLFLVNSRENSLISAQVKLIELIAKYEKAQAGLEMAVGGSNNMPLSSL
jgi:outer membrane protein TolC